MRLGNILRLGLGAVLWWVTVSAHGFDFGEVVSKSRSGEPLELVLALQNVSDEVVADLSVGLASKEAHLEARVAYPPNASVFDFRVESAAKGYQAVVTSAGPFRETHVYLLLAATSGIEVVTRKYIVILDPLLPQTDETIESETSPEKEIDETNADVGTEEVSQVELSSTSISITAGEGDSLTSIIRQLGLPDSISIYQGLYAVMQANPNAFFGNNMNRLIIGKELVIPSWQDVAKIDPDQALEAFNNQIAEYEKWLEDGSPNGVVATEPESALTPEPEPKPADPEPESEPDDYVELEQNTELESPKADSPSEQVSNENQNAPQDTVEEPALDQASNEEVANALIEQSDNVEQVATQAVVKEETELSERQETVAVVVEEQPTRSQEPILDDPSSGSIPNNVLVPDTEADSESVDGAKQSDQPISFETDEVEYRSEADQLDEAKTENLNIGEPETSDVAVIEQVGETTMDELGSANQADVVDGATPSALQSDVRGGNGEQPSDIIVATLPGEEVVPLELTNEESDDFTTAIKAVTDATTNELDTQVEPQAPEGASEMVATPPSNDELDSDPSGGFFGGNLLATVVQETVGYARQFWMWIIGLLGAVIAIGWLLTNRRRSQSEDQEQNEVVYSMEYDGPRVFGSDASNADQPDASPLDMPSKIVDEERKPGGNTEPESEPQGSPITPSEEPEEELSQTDTQIENIPESDELMVQESEDPLEAQEIRVSDQTLVEQLPQPATWEEEQVTTSESEAPNPLSDDVSNQTQTQQAQQSVFDVNPDVSKLAVGDSAQIFFEEVESEEKVDFADPETALDLARAYIKLGETKAAHEFIQSVLAHGNDAQKQEAEDLLKE